MSRRESNISKLVAARTKSKRRPPGDWRPNHGGPRLAIARLGDAPAKTAAVGPEINIAAGDGVRQAANDLRMADEAMREIHGQLVQLEQLVRRVMEARRRSPQVLVALQVDIDAILERVDDAVEGAVSNGRKLLKGQWPETFGPVDAPVACPPGVSAFTSHRLIGQDGKFLSVLRSGGLLSVGRADVAEIHAAVENVACEIEEHRLRLLDFLRSTVQPLVDALTVAGENAIAAQNLLDDLDFAVCTGQLSSAAAVAARGADTREVLSRQESTTTPVLRLVCGDNPD